MKPNKGNLLFAILLILLGGYANASYRSNVLSKPVVHLDLSATTPDYLLVEDGVFVVPSDAEVVITDL